MAEDLYNSGYKLVVNLDWAKVVIQYMNNANKRPELKYVVMDVLNMNLSSNFDIIIDKGLMDSMLCGGSASEYLKSVYEVLRVNGVFVVISHGNPDNRLVYLQELSWSVTWESVGILNL